MAIRRHRRRRPSSTEDSGASAARTGASYLKMLASLEAVAPNEHQVGLVSRIARWITNVEVVEYIARVPKWYSLWEVKEALYQNQAVPEVTREEIGRCLAVINMMYEFDTKTLSEEERGGLKEDIRWLIHTLTEDDRTSVKKRALWLTELRKKKQQADLAEAEREARVRERVSQAYAAKTFEEMTPFLQDQDASVVKAALQNPGLTERMLVRALAGSNSPMPFRLLPELPRWYNKDGIRKAIWKGPGCPEDVKESMTQTIRVLKGFQEYDAIAQDDSEKRARIARNVFTSFQALHAQEQEFVKAKLAAKWRAFLTYVLVSIGVGQKATPTPAPPQEPVPEEPETVSKDEGEAPDSAIFEKETSTVRDFVKEALERGRQEAEEPDLEQTDERVEEVPQQEEARAREPEQAQADQPAGPLNLAGMSVAEKIRLARTTRSKEEMAYLVHDPDPSIAETLLQNPDIGLEEVETLARTGTKDKVEKLQALRKWTSNPRVRDAILHNPHTPITMAQDALMQVTGLKDLMRITRDPNIGAVDLKSKARSRLVERYRSLSTEEKVEAIKSTGGEIITDLWSEALQDERVLSRLFQERYLDEAVVLRVARSRIAPREILMTIGSNRNFTSNYQVKLELVQNPKTPREVSSRLIGTLNPQDRQRLRKSKNIPEYVRKQMDGAVPG